MERSMSQFGFVSGKKVNGATYDPMWDYWDRMMKHGDNTEIDYHFIRGTGLGHFQTSFFYNPCLGRTDGYYWNFPFFPVRI